jgi:hypothetical protein
MRWWCRLSHGGGGGRWVGPKGVEPSRGGVRGEKADEATCTRKKSKKLLAVRKVLTRKQGKACGGCHAIPRSFYLHFLFLSPRIFHEKRYVYSTVPIILRCFRKQTSYINKNLYSIWTPFKMFIFSFQATPIFSYYCPWDRSNYFLAHSHCLRRQYF